MALQEPDLSRWPAEPTGAPLTFLCHGEPAAEGLRWFARGLSEALERHGHVPSPAGGGPPRLVINLTDPKRPRPYRRRSQATFVVSVVEVPAPPPDVLKAGYPILIRSLSNLLVYLVRPPDGGLRTHFVTLEQGSYALDLAPDDPEYFDGVYRRIAPLASSTLVVENIFRPDLEPELWDGDELTAALYEAGRKLDALDLLPAPFPIQELLPERDFRHLQRLYGLGGLSYGNLSARKDARRFWMSASGVNKADLRKVGEHLLMVTDYDPARNAMVLSVPPGVSRPRRVSVDAIEHWMIYREHPEVGAIVHIHAWMEGVPSTRINYPCGTLELARAVAAEVRRAPDPSRAVVGLRNHGLTICGRSLDDIFERIEGRILRQVPMS
ncbi:MAG: class II aldolase/adducin family protein [Firmicutes bacterium]|nr:class II aldolase/adducin family protein [Bacillota bacterium]